MSEYEWLQRCRMQFARRSQHFSYDWACFANECHDNSWEDFPDEPEDAADEEISYWSE